MSEKITQELHPRPTTRSTAIHTVYLLYVYDTNIQCTKKKGITFVSVPPLYPDTVCVLQLHGFVTACSLTYCLFNNQCDEVSVVLRYWSKTREWAHWPQKKSSTAGK